MGWGEWVARIGGYVAAPFTGGASIPIGEAVAQGLRSREGINEAQEAQQTATTDARAVMDRAQQTSGNVLQQQRQDFQNQANIPYQTLGSLMGIAIPDVGPVGFAPGGQTGTPAPMMPPQTYARQRPADVPSQGTAQPRPQTLGDMTAVAAPQMARQAQTQSGYGQPGGVRMRAPTGEEQTVAAHLVPIFERKGAVRI